MSRSGAIRTRTAVTLLLALIIVLILGILWTTTRVMLETWQSSTYGHCSIVIPLTLWLAWRQSAKLDAPLRPLWPGVVLIAASGFVWLIGELASASVVSQFATIAIVIAAALTVLGFRWVHALAFPLGFLFFAVPFGEGLLPTLMGWTADVTVAALRATGIPVYREDNFFVVPSGSWSIVEACSGVRFLIAALMVSCLFAWLHYRTLVKRVTFVTLALVVALVANWLRAYIFVVTAHILGNRIGTDAEHTMLGWVIFAVAMFALFAIGMRWSDNDATATAPVMRQLGVQPLRAHAIVAALMVSVLTVALWPATAAHIDARVDIRPVWIEAIAPAGGWQRIDTATGDWTPELAAPTAVDARAFTRDDGVVNVYLGLYRGQKQGSEVVNASNQVARSDSARWRVVQRGTAEVSLNGHPTVIRTAIVQGVDRKFLIWHWYWIGGRSSSSDVETKLRLAWQRLTGATDTAAWVAVYTPIGDDAAPGTRRLTAFAESMSGSVDSALVEMSR